eukprot:scaffold8375_cov33-Tisochrysis_lutea.AAC.2
MIAQMGDSSTPTPFATYTSTGRARGAYICQGSWVVILCGWDLRPTIPHLAPCISPAPRSLRSVAASERSRSAQLRRAKSRVVSQPLPDPMIEMQAVEQEGDLQPAENCRIVGMG